MSDAQLANIISNGIPDTGMPAFRSLTDKEVRAVVGYMRLLQGGAETEAGPSAGDPKRGKEVFFGKGECSTCHMISGQGGFLGPDLTEHGSTSSAATIREEIVRAGRVPSPGYRMAVLITGTGDRVEGVIRNEDNFSVQLQTKDGSFHFFNKSELRSFERLEHSLMPSNYRDRLTDKELDDVASYLMITPDPNKTPLLKKEDPE